MTENESIVNSLEVKVRKLILLQEQLKKENQDLISQNGELVDTIKLKENEFKGLQASYNHLKLAKLMVSGSEDSHEAKLKVNRIVREIDKCIALLNK